MGVGIQVEHLNAWFGKTQALYDISMNVAANHATAIIGPSGCGKSTFVRCLNRMHETIPEAHATGRVCIGDLDVSNGKIEELIFQLKEHFTIVIVTHNMQQASRVAEFTGFFLLGKLIEFDKTEKIFTTPSDKRTEDYITGRFG